MVEYRQPSGWCEQHWALKERNKYLPASQQLLLKGIRGKKGDSLQNTAGQGPYQVGPSNPSPAPGRRNGFDSSQFQKNSPQ